MFIDSHCHIHDTEFFSDNREAVYEAACDAGVNTMVVVGTDARSSREAVEFARSHTGCYAVVGIHPHEAKDGEAKDICALLEANKGEIVGIGEIGLDYYYDHSPKEVQQQMLREQLKLAQEFDLPVSFHVREAFDDFWPIFDDFSSVKGVMHSFTDTQANADEAMKRGLFIGINGIATFTKDQAQADMYASLPLEHILLETDAPFLAPKPYRGKTNQPAYVIGVADFLAEKHRIPIEQVAEATSRNANQLFHL